MCVCVRYLVSWWARRFAVFNYRFLYGFLSTHCHPKVKEPMVGSVFVLSGACLIIHLRLLYISAFVFFVHTSMFITPIVGRYRSNIREQASPSSHRVSSSDVRIFHLQCGSTSMRHSMSEHSSDKALIQRNNAGQVYVLFRKCRSL